MTGNLFKTDRPAPERKLMLLFMLVWLLINCLQACFLGVDGDEAYYWVLSKQVSWGYFDHPPLAPLLINIGESIGHGPLFTRLSAIIISTLTIPFVYAALPREYKSIRWFIVLYAATLIFNVYGFITTPDAPLLFFSAVFFYAYKKFLQKENLANTLLMAIAVTGMFYSKYHGILLVIFVVLSNVRLLFNKYFWLMVMIVTILFSPHLIWQYVHDWPTVRFHLIERLAKNYRVTYTTDYILGQLLIWGPLISLLFFYNIRRVKATDKLMRAHLFNFIGVVLFFVLSSFKNNVEPHWTLIAGVSYVVLFLSLIKNGNLKFRKVFLKTACANIGLILLARVLFLVNPSPFQLIDHFNTLFWGKQWAKELYVKAGSTPVIFPDSYAMPALYQYYNPQVETYGYNTKRYRKTNYSLYNDDCVYTGRRVYVFSDTAQHMDKIQAICTKYSSGFLIPIESYHCASPLKIQAIGWPKQFRRGETKMITVQIMNTGLNNINARDMRLDYAFFVAKNQFTNATASYLLPDTLLAPGYNKLIKIPVTAPADHNAYKRVLFSIINGNFQGNFASDFYPIIVK